MTRDVRKRTSQRQASRKFEETTLRVAADGDGLTLTSPSKIVNGA